MPAPRCQTTAYDRTGTTKLAVGKLDTIDNQIDTTTGTVKLRALFDNPDESLFPNQFVNIKLLVDTLQDTVLDPERRDPARRARAPLSISSSPTTRSPCKR